MCRAFSSLSCSVVLWRCSPWLSGSHPRFILLWPLRRSPRVSGANLNFVFVGLYNAAPEYRVPRRRLSLLCLPQRRSPRASGAIPEFILVVGLYNAAPEYRVPRRWVFLVGFGRPLEPLERSDPGGENPFARIFTLLT